MTYQVSRREIAKAIIHRKAHGGPHIGKGVISKGETIPNDLLALAGLPSNERATAQLACEVFAQPTSKSSDCYARLYGLRDATSLRPWLEEGVTDPAELARRDFQQEFGDAWLDEWERRQGEAFLMLEGRLGTDWPLTLADRISGERIDMVH